MTKEQKAKALFEAIYNATRQGIDVTFSKDFCGQVTVLLSGEGEGHIHAGSTGAAFDRAFPLMVDEAQRFIDEAIDGGACEKG